MMNQRSSSRGYVLILLVVVMLLFGVGGILYKYSQSTPASNEQRSAQLSSRFDKLESALLDFVKTNRRLPCPAAPNQLTGAESITGSSAVCATPDGVVPWGALGISEDDALDSWGRLISYRVYWVAGDGTQNGFTQLEGLNATNCNSSSLLTSSQDLKATSGLCGTTVMTPSTNLAYQNLQSDPFSAASRAGLTVYDLSTTPTSGIAYVLISHGATGYGSYDPKNAGSRYTLPAASSNETNNLSANGPFYINAITDSTVDVSATNHFDDVLRYKTQKNLVTQAALDARNWSWVSLTRTLNTTVSPNYNTFVANISSANASGSGTLTYTLTTDSPNSVSVVSNFTDTLTYGFSPGFVLALSAGATTCTGGTATASASGTTTTVTIPTGVIIPANGSCNIVFMVTDSASLPETLTASAINAGTYASGGLRTTVGWNASTILASSITSTFYAPTLSTISPTTITGSPNATSFTLSGPGGANGGFVSGATVTFTSPTGQTVVATATVNSLTSLQVSAIINPLNSGVWTAKVTNPDTQESSTVSFTVYGEGTFSATSLSTAIGLPVSAGSSTGVGIINFTNYKLTSFVTNYPNIALLTNTVTNSGGVGIGVAKTNGTTSELTSTNTGGVRLTLPTTYSSFGVTLFRFGISAGLAVERAQVSYYTTTVSATAFATQILSACTAGTGTQAASYSLNPGASFAKVEIIPLTRTVSGNASSFQLGEVAFCTSASCVTLYSANNNASNCIYP